MLLISSWSANKVYWRVFAPTDIGYVAGLADGILEPGKVAVISVAGFTELQLELKRDWIGGAFITPTLSWDANSLLVLEDDGRVTETKRPPFELPLASEWSGGTLFWRVFDPTDTRYGVGLAEGTLDRGDATRIDVVGYEQLKLELKQDNLTGEILIGANRIHDRNSVLRMTDDGLFDRDSLLEPAPAPPLTMRLTSRWSHGRLYWRIFGAQDWSRAGGVRDGLLERDATAPIVAPHHQQVQLEIKRDNVLGEELIWADHQRLWASGADLTMTDDGLLDGDRLVIPLTSGPSGAAVSFWLISAWSLGPLWWRTFRPGDPAHAIPLAEGSLARGDHVLVKSDGYPAVELELRDGGPDGPVVIAPAIRWRSSAMLTMTDAGLTLDGVVVAPMVRHTDELLRLTSTWKATPLYWRVFAPDDTDHVAGLADGIAAPGDGVSVVHAGVIGAQLELKKHDVTGEVLIAAGTVWPRGTELAFNERRQLLPVLPAPATTLRITIDDDVGPIPLLAAFVTEQVGGVDVTHVTDVDGRVPWFGASRIEVRRGTAVVCVASPSDVVDGELRLTPDRLAGAFRTLRDAFIARAGDIRPRVNEVLDAMFPRVAYDFANVLSLRTAVVDDVARGLRYTDLYVPYDTTVKDADGNPVYVYATDRIDHISADNPAGLAEKVGLAACVSHALDGASPAVATLIASIMGYYESLRDPSMPVLRRRATDRAAMIALRRRIVSAEVESDARTRELALLDALSPHRDDPGAPHDVPSAWEMETSIDEYTAIADGLAAIARWAPETGDLHGRRGLEPYAIRSRARKILRRTIDELAAASFVIATRVEKVTAIAARGPGALLASSVLLNAAEQASSNRDVLADPDIVPADYPTLRAVTMALDRRSFDDGITMCDIYRVAITGQLAPLLVTAAVIGPIAAEAAAKVATFFVPDPGILAGGVVPVAVLAAVGAGAVLAASALAHPTRPSAYHEFSATLMTTPLWGFSPYWSAALYDRGVIAAFASTEVARTWTRSMPRRDPKGGYHPMASQMKDCAQLLCTGTLDAPDQFIARMIDPHLEQRDPNFALEQAVYAWSVACIALGIRPGLTWTTYTDEVTRPPSFASMPGSRELHRPSCARLAPAPHEWFFDVAAARFAGYQICPDCLPGE